MSYAWAGYMTELRAKVERHVLELISAVVAAARAAPLGELAEAAGPNRSSITTQEPSQETQPSEDAHSQVSRAMPTNGHRLRRLRTLRRAIDWQLQLETGEIGSRAQIARREGISRAAVTLSMRPLGDLISSFDASEGLPRRRDHGGERTASGRIGRYSNLRRDFLLRFETEYVSDLLRAASGNVSQAARMAGMDRKHLWRLIKRTGLRKASSR